MADVNLNVNPYYDDYSETKDYQKVLFKPSVAVQAREVTQLQTILEKQVERHGEHIFREGSIVSGMEHTIQKGIYFALIKDTDHNSTAVTIADWKGKTVRGEESGVEGIIHTVADGTEATTISDSTGPKTIYVNVIRAGTDNISRHFVPSENLVDTSDSSKKLRVFDNVNGTIEWMGFGTQIAIDEGIIFAKGKFLIVSKQTTIIARYDHLATAKIGYKITGNFIDSASDSTLLDPAQGAPNFNAPGADRLQYTLTLTTRSLTSTDLEDFVELFKMEDGVVTKSASVPQYSELRKEFARRTFDESGDYTVQPFPIRIREHLNDGTNGGRYTLANGGDKNQLAIGIEPGTAYVQGFKHETGVTEYLNLTKAVDTEEIENQKVSAAYGNYVLCTEVVGSFPFDTLSEVSLRNAAAKAITNTTYGAAALPGSEIGKARVRSIIHSSGTPGAADCEYKLYLFDIRMTSAGKDFSDVRCVTNLSSSSDKYLADVSLTAAGTNSNVLYEDGDQLLTEDGLFKLVHEDSISGEKAVLKETGKFHKLVYTLPQNNIKTIRDSSGEVETSYKFRKEFDVTFSGTGVATVATGNSTETFPFSVGELSETNRRVNFMVVPTQTKTPFNTGQPIDFTTAGSNGARSINITTTTSATLNCNETLSGGMTAKVIVTLTRANAKEATKTLVKNQQVVIAPTTHTATTVGPWGLGRSDCFLLNKVYMSPSTSTLPTAAHTDVTSHFELDTGQRDNFYDHGQLRKLASSSLSITGQLLIDFHYFTHDTSQGIGYFSVDSYPVDDTGVTANTIKTWELPFFDSTTQGQQYDLRDTIDCRPRRTDTNTVTNPAAGSTFAFDVATAGAHMMHPNESINMDLNFYLPRKDKIVINKEGNFSIVLGTARFPIAFAPQDNSEALTLALIKMPPYPSLPPDLARKHKRPGVQIQSINSQRFTMKDIGQLEQRINRMEYYTALSLLEKDTAELQITNQQGLDRFKNGILVDPFTGHNIGDITNPDYAASIDMKKQECRPKFRLENTPLTLDATNSTTVARKPKTVILTITSVTGTFVETETVIGGTSSATAQIINQVITAGNKIYCDNLSGTFAANETITGNTSSATATVSIVSGSIEGHLVTLPYTSQVYSQNLFASKQRNCVSELLFNWVGEIELTPNTDNWVDTTSRPDVQVNFDNNMDAWEALEDAWETHWNDWETIAVGEEVVSREQIGGRLRLEGARGQKVFQQQNERVTTLKTQQQVRSGIALDITPEAITHRLGSKVVDVSIIPFIREKTISFSAKRMKPFTRVYPFFDGELVSAHCTPTGGALGADLVTDSVGNLTGTFSIPNSDALKFRIGERTFRLSDSYVITADDPTGTTTKTITAVGAEKNGTEGVTTIAEATYTARGILQSKEDTIISTSVADFQKVTMEDSRFIEELTTTINNTGERFVGEVANQEIHHHHHTHVTNVQAPAPAPPPCHGQPKEQSAAFKAHLRSGGFAHAHRETICRNGQWVDPIAQTFLIDTSGGLFVSKLDIYFATKSATLPITCQIREVVNGFPGARIIPGGTKTLFPADINISTDATAATPFYFESPVYLSHAKEYCFVLLPAGNNPDYNVWVSELGKNKIGTTERISEQPHAGILFTSANNRTWTARQAEDMKFQLYRAKFDLVATGGTGIFVNKNIDYCTINNLTGTGNFQNGEVITGATSGAKGTVEAYNKAKLRLDILNTSGTFQANETITGGTSSVSATLVSFNDFKVNVIHPQAEQITLHTTQVTWSSKTTSSSNVVDSAFQFIGINRNNTLRDEKRVLSYSNEIAQISSADSLTLKAQLFSGFDTVSPIIDLRRLSSICVENIINNDSADESLAKGGNALAKYISKRIVLDEDFDAEDIRVYITADKPSGTEVEVYYKILNGSDETDFDDRPYRKMEQVTDATLFSVDVQDLDDFKEYEYKVSSADLTGINGEIQYTGTQTEAPVFTGFKTMAIKLVMLSTTTSLVPRLKDMRTIALSV